MKTMMQERRQFLWLLPAAALAAGAGSAGAVTAGPALVDEKDPTAASLGYVVDATRADKSRFKQYAAGQQCGNCQLYGGAAGSVSGPCPMYAGKAVSAKGWCSAYVKRA